MCLFHTDSVALSYSNVEAAKQSWIDTFGCKVVRVPQDWDNPLPSDVALTLPGDSEPTILLSAQSEVEQARFDRPSPIATIIPPGRKGRISGKANQNRGPAFSSHLFTTVVANTLCFFGVSGNLEKPTSGGRTGRSA